MPRFRVAERPREGGGGEAVTASGERCARCGHESSYHIPMCKAFVPFQVGPGAAPNRSCGCEAAFVPPASEGREPRPPALLVHGRRTPTREAPRRDDKGALDSDECPPLTLRAGTSFTSPSRAPTHDGCRSESCTKGTRRTPGSIAAAPDLARRLDDMKAERDAAREALREVVRCTDNGKEAGLHGHWLRETVRRAAEGA